MDLGDCGVSAAAAWAGVEARAPPSSPPPGTEPAGVEEACCQPPTEGPAMATLSIEDFASLSASVIPLPLPLPPLLFFLLPLPLPLMSLLLPPPLAMVAALAFLPLLVLLPLFSALSLFFPFAPLSVADFAVVKSIVFFSARSSAAVFLALV